MRDLALFVILISALSSSGQSVLSSGQWHRVGVTSSGIYKLDLATLNALGVNVSDPQTIKIYGNGVKGALPQANSTARPFDLIENAILVAGESDGSFDASDYLLFYAVGPDKTDWTSNGLEYEKNSYSDTAYYFITSGGSNGKRIQNITSAPGDGLSIGTFQDAIINEEDVNNLLNSGRGWYGEVFSDNETQSFTHSIEGISSPVQLVVNGVGQSSTINEFNVSANGSTVGSLSIDPIPSGPGTTYSIKARQSLDTFQISGTENITLQFNYRANSSAGIGFIDYYALLFERNLQLTERAMSFRNTTTVGSMARYVVGGASGATIWNVSDPVNVGNQLYDLSGSDAVFQSQSSEVEEFVAFNGSDFPAPTLFGNVANQNLKGDLQIDGIIVSNPDFLSEAERLAQFHREHGGLAVKVVTTRQVYNEFSSGRQDVSAIRDYVRYVYENGGRLKYLSLFGDCSYDYKNREANNTNFVPTYESRDSFHPIFSHSSDDYFGFFEEDEGEWEESVAGDHTLEIGIGRLPVKTREEAASSVDKIIYYATSPNTLGKWRNEIAYLADDGDANIHAQHVESLSELVDTTYFQYSIDKLLLDAFEQEVGASSQRSPNASKALKEKVKSGAFTINFIGHGNERLWTEEQVLTKSLIRSFTNRNRLPIFVTATCEFGRYDDPSQVSGAEELFLSTTGGAIALLTTSRPVFASTNFELNQAFHENIFRKVDGVYQRLGDIMRLTKNDGLAGPVNRNFTLLGDPMMMPAYPEMDITINELVNQSDTLSALEEITYSGSVTNNGAVSSDFNGRVSVAVFDIAQRFQTIGQESNPYDYSLQNNALFRGESSVVDGSFSFTFIVPKNISYQFKEGKISLYAWDDSNNMDAAGSSKSIVLGGTSSNVDTDNQSPEVTMFLNDESFVNGSVVGSSSLLIAHVSDENGISITSNGFSQGISLELAGEIINLNEFYSADLDTYQSGTITYPIQDLDPGVYTAVLNVYDSYNNLTKRELNFSVSGESFISVFDPKAYPNPVINRTTFSFDHDREEEDLEIQLLIYSDQGSIVNRTNFEFENSSRTVELPWEARTNSGQLLVPGVYFYRLIITSRIDGATKEIANKLVIAN